MTLDELRRELSTASNGHDCVGSLGAIVDRLSAFDDAPSAVAVILEFLELHPDLDVGTPGPLVHYVERFFGRGYEAQLTDSVRRRPTEHTL